MSPGKIMKILLLAISLAAVATIIYVSVANLLGSLGW